MNLRGIANSVARTVNPNTPVILRRSTGYTIGAGRKQVPSYADDVSGFGQMQAMTQADLKQIDGLNIQGTIRALYLYGDIAAVSRPDQTGGDLVVIDGKTWLVVQVLEAWGWWTKVAIVLQENV